MTSCGLPRDTSVLFSMHKVHGGCLPLKNLMLRRFTTPLFILAIQLCITATPASAASTTTAMSAWDLYSDTWVATDGLGRELPGFEECGPPKANKTVGMFYYLWHDSARGEVRDNARALLDDPDHRSFGPRGQWHWWGEPLLGYYLISDPSVIRTHAAMLTDAGIDTIICDVTNAITYPDQVSSVFNTYREIRQSGQTTPQIGFITHSKTCRDKSQTRRSGIFKGCRF